MKLSPNLRKKTKKSEEALKENNSKLLLKLKEEKLDDILAQVGPIDNYWLKKYIWKSQINIMYYSIHKNIH